MKITARLLAASVAVGDAIVLRYPFRYGLQTAVLPTDDAFYQAADSP